VTHAEAQPDAPLSWPAKLAIAAKDIKLAHSVFALPFALLGAFIAFAPLVNSALYVPVPVTPGAPQPSWSPWRWFAGNLALVVVCMVAARTFAMLVNRFVDRRIDAENPRTAKRAFAAGKLRHRDAVIMLAASVSLFTLGTAGFGAFYGNWLPLFAGPFVLAWLAFYSYTKRFTFLCHLVLGVALALSPIAAAGAIGGLPLVAFWPHESFGWFEQVADLYLLAAFVACWVAGFDVIYAMQDETFDRAKGLHSIPARLGTRGAAWISRALHAIGLLCLWRAASVSDPLGLSFALATGLTAGLLVTEHVVLAVRGHAGIPMAFFTLNGVIAIVLGAAGIIDIVM